LYFSVDAQKSRRLNALPLQVVRLLPGIFKDAQHTDLNYMMSMSPGRLLAPYRREAGLRPKAKKTILTGKIQAWTDTWRDMTFQPYR
jgi:hypothetical protein